MKRIITVLLSIAIVLSTTCTVAFASDQSIPGAVFSTVPSERAQKNFDQLLRTTPRRGWYTDSDGKVHVIELDGSGRNDGMLRSPPNYHNVVWTPGDYIPNYHAKKDFAFPVGGVTLRNTSQNPISLKYRQENSNTVRWQVEGGADIEAKFGTKILADLKAQFSVNVQKAWTAMQGTSVEFEMIIPVGKIGHIDKYYGGVYSGGIAVWHGYNPMGGYKTQDWREETGAWGIDPDKVAYDTYLT